ncbi:hypothetical protein AALO_G00014840 [Alosa alosa]|uniref:Uncharacterized protein n=1 Tax=Alosa alosa TaxID=278164 RepID=A0AAV6HLQ3_9TELE|nr:hypothetical protein AALO_G00014840 [Alosa alosa]
MKVAIITVCLLGLSFAAPHGDELAREKRSSSGENNRGFGFNPYPYPYFPPFQDQNNALQSILPLLLALLITPAPAAAAAGGG